MNIETTLGIAIFAGIITIFANWKSRQEYAPGEMPLIPWNGVQFLGILVIFLMAAHMITLLTGQPFRGRMGGF